VDKVLWLVTGNKGGVGKSVVAKALVEWLEAGSVDVAVVDGDKRTPDVAAAFAERLRTEAFDLQEETGWSRCGDYLCRLDHDGHVVANLPDGITERTVRFMERTVSLVENYGYATKALFVMNTLPDGLSLLKSLNASIPSLVPVKNLHFGRARAFTHFDEAYGAELEPRTVLFPAMSPNVMRVVRESHLSYAGFVAQRGDTVSNLLYPKVVVADWSLAVTEVFDDTLTEV
jgi:hypothetical protein